MNQPLILMPAGSKITQGNEAKKTSTQMARLVADIVKTTLGPKGMDKLLVDPFGDVTVTNDGATILKEMNIDHPIGKLIVKIAETQETEVGDGTTSSVILAGSLLEKAEKLQEKGIHVSTICKGYKKSAQKAVSFLHDIAKTVEKDDGILKKAVETAITGKSAEEEKEIISDLVLEAVSKVFEQDNPDKNDIKLVKKSGGKTSDSCVIDGIIVEKERCHSEMPISVENAKILLVDCAIEIKKMENTAKFEISTPEQMDDFIKAEETSVIRIINAIVNSGANVVFCQRSIDDFAKGVLNEKKIFAVQRTDKEDMVRLAKSTGAFIVGDPRNFKAEKTGKAGLVSEKSYGGSVVVAVESCEAAKSLTILVRGPTSQVVDETKRAIDDAVGVAFSLKQSASFVSGAGAIQMNLSRKVRDWSSSLPGREQLAADAFADALESIPSCLAENAGLDVIDILTDLRAKHSEGKTDFGVNVEDGGIMDAFEKGVVEPSQVVEQAIMSASEVACMILRIDDIISVAHTPGKDAPMPS